MTERELELAELLMHSLVGVEIQELHDEYAAALEQPVVAKMAGEGLEEPVPADLMAALEAGIRAANRGIPKS
ncbi:hypothetical protein ACFYXS_00615 [Streptomyces sp. NPDC002574]|uniref:hypothetical protein n=1 Tax=Streptomyces sp. NPDC002574 TaxID=3364652 RepID=UPI0036C8A51A